MKGQMTLEFLVILLILTSYLSVVFALFSSSRNSLETAVDRKLLSRVADWIEFISARPEGTEVRFEAAPFPGHFLGIACGDMTVLETNSESRVLNISSLCAPVNLTGATCLSVKRLGGVGIEVC